MKPIHYPLTSFSQPELTTQPLSVKVNSWETETVNVPFFHVPTALGTQPPPDPYPRKKLKERAWKSIRCPPFLCTNLFYPRYVPRDNTSWTLQSTSESISTSYICYLFPTHKEPLLGQPPPGVGSRRKNHSKNLKNKTQSNPYIPHSSACPIHRKLLMIKLNLCNY